MKKIIAVAILTVIANLCFLENAKCVENVKINNSGVTTIKSGNNIKIEVIVKTVKEERFTYAVKKISISVNGVNLFVPRSIYGDLYEPNEAHIGSEKHLTYLEITGGDGSESYFVRIYFDKKQVKRRIVFSSMIPDKPLEETTYWKREL
jgi:hypothetical protein